MLNYMKSEYYRISRGKGLYMTIAILTGAVILMNIVLALGQRYIPDFRYGTVRFSLNTYTSMIYCIVVMGAVVSGCLFIDDRRNGVLKNIVSYGISREKILIGKCIVAFGFAFFIMCAVLAIYVGSSYLLLENREWLPLRELLMGTAASLPSAAASLIFMMTLGLLYQKEMTAVLWWAVIYYLVPMVCFLIGLKFDLFARIASWMPYNFLRIEAIVTYHEYHCLWDTSSGLARCILSGVIGIVLFSIFGIWRFGKQEL